MARWPWFRFYDEAADDPKVQLLDDYMFRKWILILCAANRSSVRGALPPTEQLAWTLRVSEDECTRITEFLEDRQLLVRVWADTVSKRLLKPGDEPRNARQGYALVLSPHNWSGRQFDSDGTSTDRWHKFIATKREGMAHPPTNSEQTFGQTFAPNGLDTETEQKQNRNRTEKNEEGAERVRALHAPQSPHGVKKSVPVSSQREEMPGAPVEVPTVPLTDTAPSRSVALRANTPAGGPTPTPTQERPAPATSVAEKGHGKGGLRPIPDDFAITEGMRAWAERTLVENKPVREWLNLDVETEEFRTWWGGAGRMKKNWVLTWYNNMLTKAQRAAERERDRRARMNGSGGTRTYANNGSSRSGGSGGGGRLTPIPKSTSSTQSKFERDKLIPGFEDDEYYD